jgi:hypothetical protein
MLRVAFLFGTLCAVSTAFAESADEIAGAPSTRPPVATIGFPRSSELSFEQRFRLATRHDSTFVPDLLRVELSAPSRSPSPIRGLLRPTPFELSQTQSTLKGVRAGATAAMFLGAVSNTYGLWDTKKNWWLVGGAAALGGLYGGTLGHDNVSWRVETRLTDE